MSILAPAHAGLREEEEGKHKTGQFFKAKGAFCLFGKLIRYDKHSCSKRLFSSQCESIKLMRRAMHSGWYQLPFSSEVRQQRWCLCWLLRVSLPVRLHFKRGSVTSVSGGRNRHKKGRSACDCQRLGLYRSSLTPLGLRKVMVRVDEVISKYTKNTYASLLCATQEAFRYFFCLLISSTSELLTHTNTSYIWMHDVVHKLLRLLLVHKAEQ